MTDLGDDPEEESPTPAAPPATPPEEGKWKEENAKLREENRRLNASAIGAKFGLPPTIVGLLSSIPKDQQEAKAQELADELKVQPSEDPKPEPTPAPEPDEADALKGMGSPPTPPDTPAVTGSEAVWEEKVKATKSIEELMALQQNAIREQRGQG